MENLMYPARKRNTKQDEGILLTDEDCPMCNGSKEILNTKVRSIGYTLTEGETIDEVLIPCPLCERVKSQLKKFVEWGNEGCKEHDQIMRRFQRRFCDECWQSLLKEIE